MADKHHKPEAGIPTTRCYTVSYVSDAQYHRVAALTLKGRWLGAMGFATGTPLEVRVLSSCLIITARKPAGPEVVT